MAYDPEARTQSKNALIIGLVALLLIGGVALAYLSTRRDPEPGPTTVVTSPRKETVTVQNTVPVPVEVPGQTIVVTPPIVTPPVTTTTTRNTTTTTSNRTIVVVPTSAPNASAGTITNGVVPVPETRANTNANVTNVAPNGSSAGNGASNNSSNSRAAAPATSTGNEMTTSNAAPAPAESASGNTAPGY